MKAYTAHNELMACRFVKPYDETSIKMSSSPTDKTIGVTDTINTQANDIADVFMAGEEAYIEAGGTFSAGDRLTPDENGKAVACTDGDYICAIALENGTAEQKAKCLITLGGVYYIPVDEDGES